jgi:hypothetical protein
MREPFTRIVTRVQQKLAISGCPASAGVTFVAKGGLAIA